MTHLVMLPFSSLDISTRERNLISGQLLEVMLSTLGKIRYFNHNDLCHLYKGKMLGIGSYKILKSNCKKIQTFWLSLWSYSQCPTGDLKSLITEIHLSTLLKNQVMCILVIASLISPRARFLSLSPAGIMVQIIFFVFLGSGEALSCVF